MSQSLINQGNILTTKEKIKNELYDLAKSQSLINQGNILTDSLKKATEEKEQLVAIPYKSGKYSYLLKYPRKLIKKK